MTRKKDTVYGIKRLESKNARAAIIQKISADFNLMPIMAEAYYKQIAGYFQEQVPTFNSPQDRSATRRSLLRNPPGNISRLRRKFPVG